MVSYEEAQQFAKYYLSECTSNMTQVDIDVALADWILLNRTK